jgi:hypothetical protein
MHQMERSWSLDEQVDPTVSTQALTFEDLFADQHERLYRALYLSHRSTSATSTCTPTGE